MFKEHENCMFQNENNVVLNTNSVEENHVQIKKVRDLISQLSYTDVMMNVKLLAVVTPQPIYQINLPHYKQTPYDIWRGRYRYEPFPYIDPKFNSKGK